MEPSQANEPPRFPDPPKDFDPRKASPKELEDYGFPPAPEESNDPDSPSAFWKDAMGAVLTYQSPPSPVLVTKILESRTWSGAIVPPQPRQSVHLYGNQPPKPGEFNYITSSWIIPDACPPPEGDPQGNYACYTCVGFDGWDPKKPLPPLKSEPQTPPALLGGAKSIYSFDCCHKECHCAKVFIQYDKTQEVFDSPTVRPGDLVSAFLWINDGSVGPCRFSTFRFFIVNKNTGKYTRIVRILPSSFRGATAEWILGRQNLDYGNPGVPVEALPNYGATYFQKNYADYRSRLLCRPPVVYTVDNAELIDMFDQKGGKKEIISTAKKVGKNLLNVYAYQDE